MAAVAVIETGHDEMLHDAQMDYYGQRLATCSSDKTIRIFDSIQGTYQLAAIINDHDGAVWQVCWAHPRFGSLLASCSYDRKVVVWTEVTRGKWLRLYTHTFHASSVNTIRWGPEEFGLSLACGSSDGFVSVITCDEESKWSCDSWECHLGGCNSVDWASSCETGALVHNEASVLSKRLVTSGCDNLIKIWIHDDVEKKWDCQHVLKQHTDWVNDVAWCPNIGLPGSRLASCGQDKKTYVWTYNKETNDWSTVCLPDTFDTVWRVAWSLSGYVLAVTNSDKVTLWNRSDDGDWKKLQEIAQ